MGKEHNEQMEYKNALKGLYFSKEAKERMIKELLKNSGNGVGTRRQRRRSFPLAAAAVIAAAMLSVGAGATVVYHQLASESFADVFGAAHTEIVDSIGRPVGASCTDNGVTVTADAIIGDKYHYAITYTIVREDEVPFDTSRTINGKYLPYGFEECDIDIGRVGGEHGTSYFYDADPADNAIQFVEMREAGDEVLNHTVRATFKNLAGFDEEGERQCIAEGVWKLKFDLNFEDTSISLPAGQTFDLNGMNAVIDAVTLSPVALRVDYTVDSELQWDPNAQSGHQSDHDHIQVQQYFESVPIFLRMTDGTEIDLSKAGGSIKPQNGKTVCQKGNMFDRIVPLDKIASVTVGGIELPVEGSK